MSTTVNDSKRHLEINATEFDGQLDGTIKTNTTAITQSAGDNSTKVATTAYADAVLPSWVPSSNPNYLTGINSGLVTTALGFTPYNATNPNNYITGYTVTQGDVTGHQAALSITESQISDLQSYLTAVPSGYATESYVQTQITNLVDSAPSALNTLDELAAALGDDANFATTITTSIGTKLPLAGGDLTGVLKITDGSAGAPAIAFTNSGSDHTGIYRSNYDTNKDNLNFAVDGSTKAYVNEAGIFSNNNVYFAGSLRKFGEWQATSGTSGQGFKFTNTADSSDALTLSSAGNAVFGGNVTASGGTLNLGNDVSIFDDGVNILRTDDILHANNDIHVGGAGKIFDRANTSNYIELANTINISTNTTINGALTVNYNGDAVNLRSTTNGQPTNLTFSTNVPHSQIGHIKYTHSNSSSYGGGDSFTIGGTETTTVILADGQLMYKDGIYSKPGSGTGAGTRKDANWDTAYTHSQSTHAPTNADATPSWVPSSDPNYLTSVPSQTWASITGKPSTFTPSAHNQAWSTITSTPTTISGYGITDAFDGAYGSLTGTPTIPTDFVSAANGGTFSGDLTISSTAPNLILEDTNGRSIEMDINGNTFRIDDVGNNAAIFTSDLSTNPVQTTFGGPLSAGSYSLTAGSLDINGNADISGNLDLHDQITSYAGGALFRKKNDSWSNGTTHDVLYQGWYANTGDYVYLKAPGNSGNDHGIAFIGDDVIALGRSDVETGNIDSNSATAPLSENWFVLNSSSATFAGNVDFSNNKGLTWAGSHSVRVESNILKLNASGGIQAQNNATFQGSITGKDSGIIIDSLGGPYGRIHGTSSIFLGGASTSQVQLSSKLIPDGDSTRDLGSSSRYWKDAYIDTITTTGKIQCGGELEGTSLDINGNADIAGNLYVQKSSSHTAQGSFSASEAHLDLYNSLEANTDQKGSILTFTDNYYDGSSYHKTTRAGIKGGTDTTGNTADGYLEFYTDSGGANSPTLALRLDKNQNATFHGDARLPQSGKLYTWTGHDLNYLRYDKWTASASAGMTIENSSANGEIYLRSGNALALTLDDSQNATFGGDVTLSGTAPTLRIQDSRNLNVGDWDDVSLGNIEFYTSDTTSPGARVLAEVEAFSNNAAASGPNAELRFKTSSITDSSPQTRLTIDHNGNSTFAGTIASGAITTTGTITLPNSNTLTGSSGKVAFNGRVSGSTPTGTTDFTTKAYVDLQISNLIDGAPASLDTLNELAEALNDDDDAVVTINTALGNRYTKTESDNRYLQSYTETNNLSSAVTWANVPNANITQGSVTQHQGALSITESQISDLGSYLTSLSGAILTSGNQTSSGNKTFNGQIIANNSIYLDDGEGIYITGQTYPSLTLTGDEPTLQSGQGDTCFLGDNVRVNGDLTVNGGDITLNGTGKITGIDTVTAATHAANKSYVDTQVATRAASSHTHTFASLTSKPTTISGYGITDAFDGAYGSLSGTPTIPSGNQIIDWTANGAGTIHSSNYTNSTYNKASFDLDHLFDLVGAAADTSTNMGSYTSTSVPASQTIRQNIEALSTRRENFIVACSDETSDLTTGTAKVTFRMPYAMQIGEVRASLTTATSSGVVTVDININGSSIFGDGETGTRLTIDAGERTSTTAATAYNFVSSATVVTFGDDAEVSIDIDTVGTEGTGKGLKVTLIGYQR